jgi:hypothetical protein
MELSNHTSCGADKVYQPLLEYIGKKARGEFTPPYVPKCPLLPLHKLSQLAVLWKEAGFAKEASELAHWILQLAPFPALWCPEKEYREMDRKELASLHPVVGEAPAIDLTLLRAGAISAALTLDGEGTSLGAIRGHGVEIRAFGPQSASLQFGIQGRGLDGWTHTAAYPEVWLEMKPAVEKETLKLDVRFVGITLETPLFFAFYVKAHSCQIGAEVLKPKSLRRYQGEVARVAFDQKLTIEVGQPQKVQVIPLAGEGCFWDTDFLILFELNPFLSQVSFRIS